jgi:N-acetylmuramoyl-L-alanine amidase
MRSVFTALLFLTAIVYLQGMIHFASAQTTLERISAVERGDKLGHVVRFHLTQAADSFKVVQPSPDLIQVKLYGQNIDTTGLTKQEPNAVFGGFHLYRMLDGYGVDIELKPGHYFTARAYPDQNGRHLLIGLTNTSLSEITLLTENIEAIIWSRYSLYNNTDEYSLEDDGFFDSGNENRRFKVIVLDAGHGAHDPGTKNDNLRLYEKDIALAVTLKIGEYIEQNLPDVQVIYTRTEDKFLSLRERGLIATRARADLFVSIHVNAAVNPQAYGAEFFFLGLALSQDALDVMKKENSVPNGSNGSLELSEEDLLTYELTNAGNMAASQRLGEMIEEQFRTRAGRRSRGVKQAGFEILWNAATPGILVELGFLSNPEEARYMNSEYGQSILASAVFRAIRDYKLEYERSLRVSNDSN